MPYLHVKEGRGRERMGREGKEGKEEEKRGEHVRKKRKKRGEKSGVLWIVLTLFSKTRVFYELYLILTLSLMGMGSL